MKTKPRMFNAEPVNACGLLKPINTYLPRITGVRTETVHLEEPFVDMAARFAHEPGAVVLLSGGDQGCARYHILGLHPWLSLTGRPEETTVVVDGTITWRHKHRWIVLKRFWLDAV